MHLNFYLWEKQKQTIGLVLRTTLGLDVNDSIFDLCFIVQATLSDFITWYLELLPMRFLLYYLLL